MGELGQTGKVARTQEEVLQLVVVLRAVVTGNSWSGIGGLSFCLYVSGLHQSPAQSASLRTAPNSRNTNRKAVPRRACTVCK